VRPSRAFVNGECTVTTILLVVRRPAGGRRAHRKDAVTDEVALYRKYRPQTPEEVVGQEHVVRALVGAVRDGRLSHAFLFCGPRGTGKTSTARILAKMVNCERGPTPEPCGVCEQCVRIREGSHLDVVEIDAASHGGVDDARELRERAPTAPAMGREKVYILDEAQRLSREAFDALLKVFEEPPPGVRFVLATTEPHKMPATIVSRCQRFDFRRLPTEATADLLERVAKQEGIVLDRPAAELIARQSEGSAREAEKLLDQSSVLGGGEVTVDTVQTLIGAPQGDAQYELADAVAVQDARGMFELVQRVVQEGHDLRHVTAQTLAHFRDLLLVRCAPQEPAVLDADPERHARLGAQAAKFTVAELSRILSLLVAAQSDMRWTTSPRLTLELALVRATIPEADPNPAGLAARMERLERLAGVTGARPVAPAAATPQTPEPAPVAEPPVVVVPDAGEETGPAEPASAEPATVKGTEAPAGDTPGPAGPEATVKGTETPAGDTPGPAAEAEAAQPHAPSADALDIATIRRSWGRLLDSLSERRMMILRANLESVTAAAYDGSVLELAFPPGKKYAVQKVQSKEAEFREAFAELFGVRPRLRCVARDPVGGEPAAVEDEPPTSREDAVARLKAEFGAVEEDEP
jgi:DNA polymerase III subunit gamma/tau